MYSKFMKDWEKQDKPRICEESRDTCQYCAHEHADSKSFPCSRCSSNYISQFKPKPIFTEDEVAVLRHMAHAGITTVLRDDKGVICWRTANIGGVMAIPSGFLASLLPGQSVEIAEVLK